MIPAPAARLLVWSCQQVLGGALVLAGASLLLFALVEAAPGDAGDPGGLRGPRARETALPGADLDPWPERYGRWAGRALRGDFGRSAAVQQGRPVAELLRGAAGNSLALCAAALGLATLGALGLATLRAVRPRGAVGAALEWSVQLASTVPVFLYAYAAVVAGNAGLAWGAREGLWQLPGWFPFPSRVAAAPWCAAVFILAVGDGLLADLSQRFRADLEQALRQDHLVGTRVLGLSVAAAVARGFLPALVSHLARRVAFVLGALVVLESALGWPGVGNLAWRAAAERDLPVLLGVALVLALVVRLGFIASQAVGYLTDPRRRSP